MEETTKLLLKVQEHAPAKEKAAVITPEEEGDERGRARWEVAKAVAAFAFCSTCLVMVNKLAVHYLPSPGLVLFSQLLTAATSIQLLDDSGVIECDDLEMHKVRSFIPAAITFALTIFTSVKVLQFNGAETFIVLRCAALIPVTVLDFKFLGRGFPSSQSLASMALIIIGAIGYTAADSSFIHGGYFWIFAWLLVFVFDQVYIKHVVDTEHMTTSSLVFYTSILSMPALVVLGLAFDSQGLSVSLAHVSTPAVLVLLFSCALGTGMSFSSYLLRKMVSATTFTMVGTMCKICSVLVNVIVLNERVTMQGLACLVLAMAAGLLYKQAPMRGVQ